MSLKILFLLKNYKNTFYFIDVFDGVSPELQQKMIVICAESNFNFMDRCNLLLLAIKRFPSSATTYGVSFKSFYFQNYSYL